MGGCGDTPTRGGFLLTPELGEPAAEFGELGDRTFLDNLAVIDEQDVVCVADGAESMRDHHLGASAWIATDGLGDCRLVLGVQGTGGFVDEQYGRGFEQGTGDADALTLSSRQCGAGFTDAGLVGVGSRWMISSTRANAMACWVCCSFALGCPTRMLSRIGPSKR